MNLKSSSNYTIRTLMLGTALAVGVVGYSAGQQNFFSTNQALADPVKVDAPAVFSFGDVVEAVSPAVVSVRVEAKFQPANANENFNDRGRRFFEEFFGNREGWNNRREGRKFRDRGARRGFSQGSGFFVSEDGYVVTNHHVVDGGTEFTIVTSSGEELSASLVGTDPRTDLAVLKVDDGSDFTYVDFSQARPRIGDWVVAVGNPFGLGGTVTAGIVSAHGRDIGASRYDDFIQIDAAVNKGNSGGPAFNLNGEVIGINTAIFSPSGGNVGIAFAIPASLADEVVADLIENGSVTRGWLGVQIQPLNAEIAESLGLDFDKGAIVTAPQAGSPAEEAGLEAGDIITKVDAEKIDGSKELARVIASYKPGTDVDMEIWRDDSTQNVTVTLGKLDADVVASAPEAGDGDIRTVKRLGMKVQESSEGIVVLDVESGSRAAERDIRPGDVIVSVSGEDVTTFKGLRDELKNVRKSGRNAALLEIRRQDQVVFIPIPVVRRG